MISQHGRKVRVICQHCRKVLANRPRGLCWSCYYTPGVREKFPSTSKFARRGVGDFNGRIRLPETATDAEPGSEEKLRILEERARLGLSLFHPDDARAPRPVTLTTVSLGA